MRFIVLIVLLLGAGTLHAASCGGHPWTSNLPSAFNEQQFKAITDLSKPVIESEVATAKKLLENVQTLEISDVKASILMGEDFKNRTAYRLYLVRALKDSTNANIVVYRYKDILFLESIRMEPVNKVIESPMVVMLDVHPSTIYISCAKAML